MDEHALRELIHLVKLGQLPRRRFVQTMVGLGLTAPLAAHMLAAAGIAQAQPRVSGVSPTRRGGGGPVRLLYWAAPTILNPHLAVSPKDLEASEMFYEPLADIDTDGNIVPVLARELPSPDNGGVAKDGTSVTWRLKPGVLWHDGRPFTADDVIFTWQYAADSATAATSTGSYRDIERIERLDDHTVKLVFKHPTPFWADAFCSAHGMVLPRHVFEPYRGGRSREAPANFKPLGTGPYRFVDFKAGDIVRAEINPAYHVPNRPFFDAIELKGGGDASRPPGPCSRPASTTTPGASRWKTIPCAGWRRAPRAGSSSAEPQRRVHPAEQREVQRALDARSPRAFPSRGVRAGDRSDPESRRRRRRRWR